MTQKTEDNIPDNALSVNQEAQAIIDLSVEREARCKQKVLQQMLKVLNQVCDQNQLQYFAMGKLLAQCIHGMDSYPNSRSYIIGMMRRDYDLFFKAIKEPAKEAGIQVFPFYDERGVLKRVHSSLRKKEVFKDKLGKLEITLELRIEPYDYLPADEKERQSFYKEAAVQAREYRLLSNDYLEKMKKAGAGLPGKIKRFWNRAQMAGAFPKKNRTYRGFIQKYQNIKEPIWAGRVETLIYPIHRLEEIFPAQKKDFIGTKLMLPADIRDFMVGLKEEESAKIAQQRLEELQAFDKMCKRHGLTYFTIQQLASAITHYQDYKTGTERKSWALGMLREDYEKAVEILEAGSESEGLILQLSVEEYPMIHGKQTSVVLEQYKKKIPGDHDFPIEIYPFDAVPEDYDETIAFMEELKKDFEDFDKQIMVEKGLMHPIWNEDLNTWKQFDFIQKKRQRYNRPGVLPKRIYTLTNNGCSLCVYDEIFPVERRPFHDFSLLCPKNPFIWHYKKDEEYTEYLAGERTKLLKILDEICQERNIIYFPIAKLLIGAVVYHDVMPKSDAGEFTLALFRDEYETLLDFLRNHGAQYGIQLNEFYDPKGKKYPLKHRNVSFTGGEFSHVMIVLAAFDKVPEDFYFKNGFHDDLDEMNQNYQDLITYHSLKRDTLKTLYSGKELADKLKYVKEANVKEEAEKIETFARTFNEDETVHTYGRNAFARSKRITREELFPLQRVKFRDITLNCPRDYTPWQPVLNAELERQVAAIQKADLILVKEFDRVCRELGLGYFICGGTMLGYMRHEGFIPWDDDVDVAMLREDYDRFIREAGPLLMEGVFLQTRQTDPNIPYLFSKIRLDNTEYITDYNDKRDFHKGICLDIFPFDYVPNNLEEREQFVEDVRALASEHHLIARRQFPVPEEPCRPKNELEERYYKEQEKLREYYWSQNLSKTQDAYLKEATKYNDHAKEKELHTVASFVPTYTFIELKDLLPYQRGIFEGVEVSVPKRPDVFLKMQYGDFMELPPKHQQVAHRLVRWSTWEESWDKLPESEK